MKDDLVKVETLSVGDFFESGDVVYLKVELPRFNFMYTKGVTIKGEVKKFGDDEYVKPASIEQFVSYNGNN